MQPYALDVEEQMQRFYRSLSEKDRRRYAAVEAFKLGGAALRTLANSSSVMTNRFATA